MTKAGEARWGELESLWQSVDDGSRSEAWVRERVDRQTRFLRRLVVAEVLITAAMLGLLAVVVAAERTTVAVGMSLAAVAHSALVWGFSIWNRAGIWRPLGESTRQYLALAMERGVRQRRSARFVIGLVSIEAILVTWLVLSSRTSEPSSRLPVWWVPPLTVIVGALSWAVWADRRANQTLARLRAVEQTLGYSDGPPPASGH